jgi:hypothetical protein
MRGEALGFNPVTVCIWDNENLAVGQDTVDVEDEDLDVSCA